MLSRRRMITNGREQSDWVWRKGRLAMASNAWELAIKKTLKHPGADEDARTAFQKKINAWKSEGRPIVYLDESGFARDMPRTHGYSRRGKRCYDLHDWHSKGRVNAIGTIVGFAFLTVALFEGSINSEVFYAWLIQALIPVLPGNAVVVMDNATFHKRNDMIDALNKAGSTIEFLPPYSPDLNPIEKKWAQVKAIRKRERCDIDTLFSKHTHYCSL